MIRSESFADFLSLFGLNEKPVHEMACLLVLTQDINK